MRTRGITREPTTVDHLQAFISVGVLIIGMFELQLTFPASSRYRHLSTIETQALIRDLGIL
jgi:hypothetical protein